MKEALWLLRIVHVSRKVSLPPLRGNLWLSKLKFIEYRTFTKEPGQQFAVCPCRILLFILFVNYSGKVMFI